MLNIAKIMKIFYCSIIVLLISLPSEGKSLPGNESDISISCADRCGEKHSKTNPCHCDDACRFHENCCLNYPSQCNVTSYNGCPSKLISSSQILNISLQLYDLDVDKIPLEDVVIEEQSLVTLRQVKDNSSNKFFSYVNESIFEKPIFKSLINLFDNYERLLGVNEVVTEEETDEENHFLDLFMATAVGQRLYEFLGNNGYAGCGNEDTFKDILRKIWFDFYSRKTNAIDSSGFEHVFVGEIKKNSSVTGFHNWVQFYLQEKAHKVNYYGFVSKLEPDVYGIQFAWNGYPKPIGGGFIRVNPEYEFAVFTLCHILKPSLVCDVSMRDENGTAITRNIQTWSNRRVNLGHGLKHVSSAYVLS